MVPAQLDAGGGDFLGAERRTMDIMAALLVGRALADDRAARDQRRARIGGGLGERAWMSAKSWPSQSTTCQPDAR